MVILIIISNRTTYAPKIDDDAYPPILQLKSVHNIPIEGLWHWMRKTLGHSFKAFVVKGYDDRIYSPNNDLHVYVFFSYPYNFLCS